MLVIQNLGFRRGSDLCKLYADHFLHNTVELLADSRLVSVSFGEEQVTLTPENVGKALPTASEDDKIFTGWIFTLTTGNETEEVGPYTQLTNDLLDKLSSADSVAAAPSFRDQPVTPSRPSKPSKPSKTDSAKELPFADVAKSAWYYDGVKYAYENGLMNGTGANAFSPNTDTTRGMIVTILARMEGKSTSGTPWYAAGREWAMGAGISDGTNMTGKITREQLAAMLYRYAKLKGYDVSSTASLSGYTDASGVSSWAKDAMQWAVGSCLIQGSGNALAPQANASRAQIATILMRFAEKIAK